MIPAFPLKFGLILESPLTLKYPRKKLKLKIISRQNDVCHSKALKKLYKEGFKPAIILNK